MRNRLNMSWLLIAAGLAILGRSQGKHDSGSIRKRSLTKAKGRRRAFGVPIGEEDGKVVIGEYDGTIQDLAADELKTTDISPGPTNSFTSGSFLHTYERSSDGKGKGTHQWGNMAGKKDKNARKRKEKDSEYKKPRDKSSYEDSDDVPHGNVPSGDATDDNSDYGGSDSGGGNSDGNEDSSSKNNDGTDTTGSSTSDSGTSSGTDDSSSSESSSGTTNTSFSPDNEGEGSTTEDTADNRIEVINEFTLEYQIPTGTRVPNRTHYEDLAHLTSWFLDDRLYEQYMGSPDVTYIGANVNQLSTVSEFVLNLKTGTVFDSMGTVPSMDELDYVLDNLVCVPSGEDLKMYVSLLKAMESNNPFSKTTGVKCVAVTGGGDGQANAATTSTGGNDRGLVAPIAGGVAGAAVLVLLAMFVFTRHRNRKGQPVPVKDEDVGAEEGARAIDASSLEGTATASLTSNPPPESMMYVTSFQHISTQDDVHGHDDNVAAGEDGENIAVVNEMRVLRDTDMSSMDESDEDLSQVASVGAQVASGEE